MVSGGRDVETGLNFRPLFYTVTGWSLAIWADGCPLIISEQTAPPQSTLVLRASRTQEILRQLDINISFRFSKNGHLEEAFLHPQLFLFHVSKFGESVQSEPESHSSIGQ